MGAHTGVGDIGTLPDSAALSHCPTSVSLSFPIGEEQIVPISPETGSLPSPCTLLIANKAVWLFLIGFNWSQVLAVSDTQAVWGPQPELPIIFPRRSHTKAGQGTESGQIQGPCTSRDQSQ